MAQYRKKPVVIEADLFQWGMEDGVLRYNERVPKDAVKYPVELKMESKEFPGYISRYDCYNDNRGFEQGQWNPYISTLEGDMKIGEGDFIITGVNGERYPCKPDIFEKTYEKV